MDVFEEMEGEAGVEADVHAYNALITACAAAGSSEQVPTESYQSFEEWYLQLSLNDCLCVRKLQNVIVKTLVLIQF
jgi:hypothetical protein